MRQISFKCLVCQKEFISLKACKSRQPKYCTKVCSYKREVRPSTRHKQSLAKIGKQTWNKLPTIDRACGFCNSIFVIRKGACYQPKFCGMRCRNEAYKEYDYSHYKGANSHFWRGGLSTENQRLRRSGRYRNWRTAVFERDNYTCQECSIRGGYLHAHHIKPFYLFKDSRFELSNGKTLCKDCHYKTDTFGSKALNNGIITV